MAGSGEAYPWQHPRPKKRTMYTPSLSAIYLGVKAHGKKLKSLAKGPLTGLERRPIPSFGFEKRARMPAMKIDVYGSANVPSGMVAKAFKAGKIRVVSA